MRERNVSCTYIRFVVAAAGVKLSKQLYNFRAVAGRIVGPSVKGWRGARFALPLSFGTASSFGKLFVVGERRGEQEEEYNINISGRRRWRARRS